MQCYCSELTSSAYAACFVVDFDANFGCDSGGRTGRLGLRLRRPGFSQALSDWKRRELLAGSQLLAAVQCFQNCSVHRDAFKPKYCSRTQ